jgi:acyl-CoA dehydrogenase
MTSEVRPLEVELKTRVNAVAAVAALHAAQVDEKGLFPEAAMAATREQRLLGIMVPREFGGDGAGISDTAEICYGLGRACASTGMIYAMHQSSVACLIRHAGHAARGARIFRRLAANQILLASSTTEGQRGANIRSSDAALEWREKRVKLERQATVVSYGAHADGILTVARRSADAASSDQVLALFLSDDYSLEPLVGWDTLGMRGTCSTGFRLRADGECDQVLPDPYEKIHQRTMMPVSHLLWASVWAGIAASAVERARLFVRKSARQAEGQLPPGATHYTRARASLATLRALVASSLRQYENAREDETVLESFDFQSAMNLFKVNASELAMSTVMSAFQACGLSGYRNDTEFSVGRHIRDILSSSIMINNDRILANSLAPLLLNGVPEHLQD